MYRLRACAILIFVWDACTPVLHIGNKISRVGRHVGVVKLLLMNENKVRILLDRRCRPLKHGYCSTFNVLLSIILPIFHSRGRNHRRSVTFYKRRLVLF